VPGVPQWPFDRSGRSGQGLALALDLMCPFDVPVCVTMGTSLATMMPSPWSDKASSCPRVRSPSGLDSCSPPGP